MLHFSALLSGLLLCASEHFVGAWWVQCFALLPFLWVLGQSKFEWYHSALAGLILGAAYSVPRMLSLKFPIALGLGFALYLSIWWIVFSMGANYALRWPPLWAALGVAALAVLADWLNINVFAMWGTAQSWVRPWADAPVWSIHFISITGMCGLVFGLVVFQQLGIELIKFPELRSQTGIALGVLVLIAVSMNLFSSPPEKGLRKEVTVAAIGWHPEALQDSRNESIFLDVYVPAVAEAHKRGAQLLVSPETGFNIETGDRERWLKRVADLALENRICLVFGYFNSEKNDNRAAVFDSYGNFLGEYTKNHLIRFYEGYTPGTGERFQTALKFEPDKHGPVEAQLGVMICQDDNFTDLSRAYSRNGVQLMAVPTNDWGDVKREHYQSSRIRGLECKYAIIRASMNGFSAIIDANGTVLDQADHFEKGNESKLVVGTLNVGRGTQVGLFSWAGAWLVILSLLYIGFSIARFGLNR